MVQVMHFGTTGKITPEIERLVHALHRRGFRVEGRVYDRAALEERLAGNIDGETVLVDSQDRFEPRARRTLGERAKRFVARVRSGFSVLAFPFRPSAKLKSVRARALFAGNTLLGLRLLAQGDFFHGVPTAILSTWIFGYMSNAEEIYRFKSQGAAVRVHDDGKLTVDPNPGLLGGVTFIEELALTTLLRMSVGGTDAVTGDPLGVAGDAIFTAFAKTATEMPIAELYAEADRAERDGEDGRAQALRSKAETYQDLFYNLMFPTLKFLQLPVPTTDPFFQTASFVARTASNVALFAIGTYGVVREVLKRRASAPVEDTGCATLLSFAAAGGAARTVGGNEKGPGA